MQISILLMKQILELFLMILMGYIIVKTGLLKDEDSKVISKIVLYLIIPCVIINAFLIVPIVTYVLGEKWVLYGCVAMCVQLVFIWTHCKSVLGKEEKTDWKKIVFNVNMISVFLGVVLFVTRIHLPELVNHTLSSVGSMIGPASMIVTGMLIAGMNLKEIFSRGRVYGIASMRLIVIPLIALLILKISGLATWGQDSTKILLIVFLSVITPSASTVTQMCQVYGNDSQYASAINVITTVFAIVTMPLMVLIFQMVI